MRRSPACSPSWRSASRPPAPARGEGPADPLAEARPGRRRRDGRRRRPARACPGVRRVAAGRGPPQAPRRSRLARFGPLAGLRAALKKVETVLGENLATIRDELLGEAVVLALRLPPAGGPRRRGGSCSSGCPNRPLLDRLIGGLNAAQLKSRRAPPRRRPRAGRDGVPRPRVPRRPAADEFYATLDDRVFAWSNSEDLIRGAIDRQAGRGGRARAAWPDFRRVRDRLPRPRRWPACTSTPGSSSGCWRPRRSRRSRATRRCSPCSRRYLAAVRYAGAALEWRDGLILHTEEVVDPEALAPGLERWAARTDAPDAVVPPRPPVGPLMATAHVDFGAVIDGLAALVPDRDRPKLGNVRLALNGLLLGLDVRAEVVPHLGPGVAVLRRTPDGDGPAGRLPAVSRSSSAGARGVRRRAAAIDNALRTFLAIYALDEKHGGGRLRVESRTADGATVTALTPRRPFAYAIRDGRLVLGDLGRRRGPVPRRRRPTRTGPTGSSGSARRTSPTRRASRLADLRAIHDFADRRRPGPGPSTSPTASTVPSRRRPRPGPGPRA